MTKPLNERQQALIPIAALTARGDMAALAAALHAGLDAGLTINEIKEVLVQLYAYCGFPRSLNGLGQFMAVVNDRLAQGIQDEEGATATPQPSGWDSLAHGSQTQTALVGQTVSSPLFDFAPAIDRYLKAHLFGDIFQRDVLDWPTRELATISALAAIPGAQGQLKSHFAISQHNGITPEQFHAFTAVLAATCVADIAENARAVLAQYLAETSSDNKQVEKK